jgi:cytidine deaminase
MVLQADIDALLTQAKEALKRAIAPYSGFRVGAALLSGEGECFTGCNIENPSLMLSLCAERVALIKALSEGHGSFRAMAVVSGGGGYCFPCGACRQMLFEFAPGISLYLGSEEGVKKFSIEELLPYPFIK